MKIFPAGHKLALKNIASGDRVIKYGSTIGEAIADIPAGSWVHTHNLRTALKEKEEYKYDPFFVENKIDIEKKIDKIPDFRGYRRSDGQGRYQK